MPINTYKLILSCVCIIDRYHPEDIKITQEIPGSNCATVEWSFPECASSVLSLFRFSLKKEKNEVAVVEMLVAPQERRILISCLQPSTKYTVTVVAEYSDGIKRKSYMEYTHCGMFHLQALILFVCIAVAQRV